MRMALQQGHYERALTLQRHGSGEMKPAAHERDMPAAHEKVRLTDSSQSLSLPHSPESTLTRRVDAQGGSDLCDSSPMGHSTSMPQLQSPRQTPGFQEDSLLGTSTMVA